MVISQNNKVIRFGNKVVDFSIPKTPWVFKWTGYRFIENSTGIQFTFTFPATISIDWGDGNVVTYETFDRGAGTASAARYAITFLQNIDGTMGDGTGGKFSYIYADGLNKSRTISITINNRSALWSIYILGLPSQELKLVLAQFPRLSRIQSYTTFSPVNFSDLTSLPSLSVLFFPIENVVYPVEIFLTKIIEFSLVLKASQYDLPFSYTNFDKLIYLKPTLRILTLSSFLKDSDGTSAVPENVGELELETLIFGTVVSPREIIEFPEVLSRIRTLKKLICNFQATTWNNFANLVNLVTLQAGSYNGYANRYLTSNVPTVLWACPLLKSIDISGAFRAAPNPQVAIDNFINNLYAFMDANAPKTGGSTVSLRYIIWNLNRSDIGDVLTKAPSGVYQQPAGYVMGNNNGSPSTPLEKLWVMTAQYKCTFTVASPFTQQTDPVIVTMDISSGALNITFTKSFLVAYTMVIQYELTYVSRSGVVNVIDIARGDIGANLYAKTVSHTIDISTLASASVSIFNFGYSNGPANPPILLTSNNPYTQIFN